MQKLIFQLRQRLTPHQFIILSSVIVGLASGIVAIALKYFVHSIYRIFIADRIAHQSASILIFPFIG